MFISLLMTFTLPLTLIFLGEADWGPIIGSYLGAIFLGGSYIALGLFISSLTKNQIVAFILGIVACFGFFIIGADFVLAGAPIVLAPIFKFVGLGSHFYNIARGVIDTRDIIYYSSFIFLFLWLNVKIIETRAWK